MKNELLHQAVQNNVSWCTAVLDSHGMQSELLSEIWFSDNPVPRFYPNLITLQPVTEISNRVELLATKLPCGWGVKDSYATLELHASSFVVGIDACWYGRMPTAPPTCPSSDFNLSLVASDDELMSWEAAWSGQKQPIRTFRSELRDNRAVQFISASRWHRDQSTVTAQIEGGLAVIKSDGVAGISNAFGHAEAILACIEFAANLHPNRDLVGYGSGEDLAELEKIGFKSLGPLRVWLYNRTSP